MDQMFSPIPILGLKRDAELLFETNLIRAVHKFQFLYDRDNPDYENSTRVKLAWVRIGQSLLRNFSECENRWQALLQTYISSPSINWIHLEDLRKFEPYISNTFGQTPNLAQKEKLLNELLKYSPALFIRVTPHVDRQRIWANIVAECNSIKNGAYMPTLKWQRYWYNLKQEFGVQSLKLQSKLKTMGTKLDVCTYTDDDMKILKICNASATDSFANIARALGSNFELGKNAELIIPKCKNCLRQQNELIIDGICQPCSKITACKICRKGSENEVITYNKEEWSKEAIKLLPSELSSDSEIKVCIPCSRALKKKATVEWKTCRVCEANQPNLEFIYHPNNNTLRKVFKEATNFWFSENDGLPGYFCKVCKIQMQQLNNFYTKFKRTQERLRVIHAIHFVGNEANHTAMKDKKVVFIDVQQKRNQVTYLPVNKSLQSKTNPPVPEPAAVEVGAIEVPRKGTANTPSNTPFKRICIRKSPTGSKLPLVVNVINDRVKKDIPPKPTLAIKEIYSLQPSTQKSANKIQTSVNVVPTTALQPSKVDEVYSNKNVTITRKTYGLPTSSQLQANTFSTPTIKSITLENSTNAVPQAGIGVNKQLTIKKSLGQPGAIIPVPNKPINTQPTNGNSHVIPTTPSLMPRCEPSNSMNSNASVSATKAIYTVADYETIEDAPPVFCIPKNAENTEPRDKNPSDAEKQLMDFVPNPQTVIKTETIDDSENSSDGTGSKIDLTENVGVIQSLPSSKNLPPKSDMKIIRLNGAMVAVKPHPYIPGAFMPVDSDKCAQKLPGCPNRFIPSIIRRVENGEKPQSSGVKILKEINPQEETITIPDHGPLPKITKQTQPKPPEQVQPKSSATIVMDPGQGEMYLQQQQGMKKARKYWGTIDEFQVAALPNKMPPPPLPLAEITEPNAVLGINSSSQRIENNQTHLPLVAPINIPPIQRPSEVRIKKEIPDNDDYIIPMEALQSSDSIPTMFYPDSFELENISLGPDVSLMINDMMSQKNPFDHYINPSFPISYGERELKEQKEEREKLKRKKEDDQMIKKAHEQKNVENNKKDSKVPTHIKQRKLYIILKRDKRIQAVRPKRSCTVQMQSPVSKRKSSRLSLT